ncbi:putative membrane protein [Bradyrhizobium sp. USDA 3240]
MKPRPPGEARPRWRRRSVTPGGWRANCAPRPGCVTGKITAVWGNSATALLALGGLATVDILFLLPLLFAVTLVMLVIGLVLFALGIVGIGLLLSLVKVGHFASAAAMLLRAVAGIGLITGSVGGGALLLLALDGAVKMLGNYARLHYRLLKPEQDPT